MHFGVFLEIRREIDFINTFCKQTDNILEKKFRFITGQRKSFLGTLFSNCKHFEYLTRQFHGAMIKYNYVLCCRRNYLGAKGYTQTYWKYALKETLYELHLF